MKKNLGLDLGTTSIGWAFVHEAENEHEVSEIKRLGVRVSPICCDKQSDEKNNGNYGSTQLPSNFYGL